MTLQKQLSIWLVVLLALVLCLWLLGDIMLPFIAGLVIAYFLDPVADRLELAGLNRTAATSLIIGLFILFVIIECETLMLNN